MRQIRPTIDELKKRYSCAMARRKMIERHHAAHPGLANATKTPDNSEPWLPHPPRTVDECAWIAAQVGGVVATWKRTFPKIFSSAQ